MTRSSCFTVGLPICLIFQICPWPATPRALSSREGLKATPDRSARAWQYLINGYTKELSRVVGSGIFNEEAQDIVIVRDIEFFSLCEHHLLPFYGKAHIAYIPNGKIIGLSSVHDDARSVSRECSDVQGIAVANGRSRSQSSARLKTNSNNSTLKNEQAGEGVVLHPRLPVGPGKALRRTEAFGCDMP